MVSDLLISLALFNRPFCHSKSDSGNTLGGGEREESVGQFHRMEKRGQRGQSHILYY